MLAVAVQIYQGIISCFTDLQYFNTTYNINNQKPSTVKQTDRQTDKQTDVMPQAVLLGGDGVGDFVAELCGDHHVMRGRDVLQQHPIVVVVLNKIPNVSTWT